MNRAFSAGIWRLYKARGVAPGSRLDAAPSALNRDGRAAMSPESFSGSALALPQGTMGADSRDALGVDVCCAGRNFDLPTSSIRLVSASFNSASGTTKSDGDDFICFR